MARPAEHKLTFEGKEFGMMARCSCGEVFLSTYVTKNRREAIKEQHRRHLKNVEWVARMDAA